MKSSSVPDRRTGRGRRRDPRRRVRARDSSGSRDRPRPARGPDWGGSRRERHRPNRGGFSGSSGIASIITSMPLLGDKQPEGQDDRAAAKPSLALASSGSRKANVGNAVRDDLDLARRHAIDCRRSSSRAFSAMTTTRAESVDDPLQHVALPGCWLGQDGMQRGHDRHRQARQQRHDVAARLRRRRSRTRAAARRRRTGRHSGSRRRARSPPAARRDLEWTEGG
jgi:hypothetical protein